MTNRWIPHTSDSPDQPEWEVSVVRSDNLHGQRSWGWDGDDKLIIAAMNPDVLDWYDQDAEELKGKKLEKWEKKRKKKLKEWKILQDQQLKVAQIIADALNNAGIEELFSV